MTPLSKMAWMSPRLGKWSTMVPRWLAKSIAPSALMIVVLAVALLVAVIVIDILAERAPSVFTADALTTWVGVRVRGANFLLVPPLAVPWPPVPVLLLLQPTSVKASAAIVVAAASCRSRMCPPPSQSCRNRWNSVWYFRYFREG